MFVFQLPHMGSSLLLNPFYRFLADSVDLGFVIFTNCFSNTRLSAAVAHQKCAGTSVVVDSEFFFYHAKFQNGRICQNSIENGTAEIFRNGVGMPLNP